MTFDEWFDTICPDGYYDGRHDVLFLKKAFEMTWDAGLLEGRAEAAAKLKTSNNDWEDRMGGQFTKDEFLERRQGEW